jgi:hypothetical protein
VFAQRIYRRRLAAERAATTRTGPVPTRRSWPTVENGATEPHGAEASNEYMSGSDGVPSGSR